VIEPKSTLRGNASVTAHIGTPGNRGKKTSIDGGAERVLIMPGQDMPPKHVFVAKNLQIAHI
jgi:hypothetical protein